MRRGALSHLILTSLVLWPALCTGLEQRDNTLSWQGREFAVHFSPDIDAERRQDLLQDWIVFTTQSLGEVFGRWPRQSQELVVTPVSASGSDPIPWAQVNRGDTDRVQFYIAAGASAEQLRLAWTSYHELAHLLIPYRGWGDAWFSEGLASYYQNLMQARSGVLSERAMWQKLYEGFQRGIAEHAFDGQSLQRVSDGLRQYGGFMRVYWSGAWYFLAADSRLRMQSGGKVSLDDALGKLNRCCADTPLSVPDMVDKLDELNRVVLFRPLYDELIVSTAVPSYDTIFASLGISLRGGEVHLQQTGPGAEIRRAMTLPKQATGH